MGLQLGQAVLDDLLIPSFSFTGDLLFDVDTVQRIMMNYLECETNGNPFSYKADEEYVSPPPSDLERVGKLMESYLAEIASDRNLNVSKFISLAELLPEQSRVKEDGMYRAIDIYLKVHSHVWFCLFLFIFLSNASALITWLFIITISILENMFLISLYSFF